MPDVAKWIRETLASRREANRPPAGNVILGAALSGVVAERAGAAILFVGSTTEPSPGAALLASEPDFPRLPFAEDGIFDAESGTFVRTAGVMCATVQTGITSAQQSSTPESGTLPRTSSRE